MTAMAVSGLNEMILACEEGVARVRAEYSPDTDGPSHCDACGGELITNYIPLRPNNSSGKPVWVHIGPCVTNNSSTIAVWRRNARSASATDRTFASRIYNQWVLIRTGPLLRPDD